MGGKITVVVSRILTGFYFFSLLHVFFLFPFQWSRNHSYDRGISHKFNYFKSVPEFCSVNSIANSSRNNYHSNSCIKNSEVRSKRFKSYIADLKYQVECQAGRDDEDHRM